MTVRIQAMITELVFEHALRIRLKADVGEASSSLTSDRATLPENHDNSNSPIIDEDCADNQSDCPGTAESSRTVTPTAGAPKGKGKYEGADTQTKNTRRARPAATGRNLGQHFIGKMNNLVSSDLNSLENMIPTFVLLGQPSCSSRVRIKPNLRFM